MKSNKQASVAGEIFTSAKSAKSAKSLAASVLTHRPQADPYSVTVESGKVINRAVATHRDALKRLADR